MGTDPAQRGEAWGTQIAPPSGKKKKEFKKKKEKKEWLVEVGKMVE